MTAKRLWWARGCLLLACGPAWAADNAALPARTAGTDPPVLVAQVLPPQPASQLPPPAPPADQPPNQIAAATDAPSDAPRGSGEAPRGANPRMLGDLPGVFDLFTLFVPAVQTISTTQTVTQTKQVAVVVNIDGQRTTIRIPVTTTTIVPVQQQRIVEEPVAVREVYPFRGDFKVAENESPRPEDRVFFNYNYYSNVTSPSTFSSVPHLDTTTTIIDGNPATVSTLTPGVPNPRIDLHREVVGFEKTFLGGDASIELRAPVVEQEGPDAIGGSDFGDVTVVLKYAFLNDRVSGDVLSAGLAVTIPTGPGIPLPGGDLHSTLLQPWAGYLWNFDRFYIMGFSSVAVPTDSRDVTLLFNDIGAGYKLYQTEGDRFISAIIPTVEAHVTTPLNHRDDNSPITAPDLVVLTAGSQFEIYRNATLSVGVAAPVTGPRAFDVEAIVQFNYHF